MGRKLLRGLAKVWLWLAVCVILFGYAATWWLQGFWAMVETLPTPFNLTSVFVNGLTLLPAFGAWWLAEALERRHAATHRNAS
jgi:hypothetical protein